MCSLVRRLLLQVRNESRGFLSYFVANLVMSTRTALLLSLRCCSSSPGTTTPGDVDCNGEGECEGDVTVTDVAVTDGDWDNNGSTREDEEEDSSGDFFDAGEGKVIASDCLSLRAASESGQSGSGGGTENDPIGPVTPAPPAPLSIHMTTNQPQWTFHYARFRLTQNASTTKSG